MSRTFSMLASMLAVMAAVLVLALPARAVSVASLPDPRPGSWVLDHTATLDPATRASLEAVARDVRSAGRGELMIVVVASVDGEIPRTYATRLFNAWRIGSSARNDGVLVFAALSDRKAEIILGDGVDAPDQVRTSESIMQGEMVPRFKDGDAAGALLAGARACAGQILGVAGLSKAGVGRAAGGSSAFFLNHALGAALGGVLLLASLVGIGRAVARRRPRKCGRCGTQMTRLSEVEDDAHLDPDQRTEEQIGSVDYDVWLCRCGETEKLRYGKLFTRYSTCPSCGAKTKLKTTTTLQAATEYCEGLAQIEERCVHCPYQQSFTRSIPRRATTYSSDSSGGSFGGGSFGGGSSDSGGSSSGSGASGSW